MLLLMIMGVVGAKAETVTVSLNPLTNGSFSSNATLSGYYTTWTSNAASGVEGLTITTSGNLGMSQQNVSSYGGNLLAFKTTTVNTKEDIVITAPSGYTITGYTIKYHLMTGRGSDGYSFYNSQGSPTAAIIVNGNTAQETTVSEYSLSATSLTLGLADTKGTSANYLPIKSLIITLNDETITAGKIYTINNTNSKRGALTYDPTQSTQWIWSSGKTGATAFNANSVNCQWILYPTGNEGQYYLYNVGAQKFAMIRSDGNYGNTWAFSPSAVPVTLEPQSDGRYFIKSATGNIYMSVSNNYTGPIITYYANGDGGLPFTITKVADASSEITAQVTAAVNKLIHNTTKLSSAPTTDGWYAIKIQSRDGQTGYTNDFLYSFITEYNNSGTYYPLGHTSLAKLRPSMADATYFFHITPNGSNFQWQMPNGKYLKKNDSGKFPISTVNASDITIGFENNYTYFYNDTYADAYGNFVGETVTKGRTKYDVYPIDLTTAGLTAWKVIITGGSADTQLTCTRSDISGLTSVYNNGYFFLPTDVTPKSSDFSMPGGQSYDVNAENKTVTIEYDPSLAITAEGVTVYQGYGTTGLGNEKAVLLRMQVAPFNAMENAVMTFTLTNPDNISAVKVIETGNNVEFNSISSYTNTFEGTISNGTATIAIGSVSAGTHYYWLCATVAANATVGDVIDAALTGITYDYNGYTGTTCDLSAVGDPANSMKIFDVQSYPFYPGQEISGTTSAVYRIPAVASVEMPNGTTRIFSAVDKRYNSYTDIGGGHVIDIVVRYSDDGGKTWSTPVTIAKGDNSNDATCGYGDPSFTIGADGKIFCLFAAGNTGFFYGLNRIVMCTSEDYGETWTGPSVIAPASDSATGITFTDHAGLYDYFVTSGKGLYTSDGVLMYLLDAQTASGGTETNYLFYSTDEGATWHVDDNVVATEANEAKLVELEPGKLLSSTRSAYSRIFNEGSYTKNSDGTCTFTWGTQRTESLLTQNGSGNNQDVIVYNRNADLSAKVLLHTITSGNGHKTLKLFMSIDQGTSWNEVMQVQPGGSRYAVMTVLPNGDLGILFEDYSLETGNQYPINFLTITKEQIAEWVESEVTFHIVDGNGNTMMDKTETVYGNLSELPKDLKRAFCTYTMYSDASLTQQIQKVGANTDVYVKCEFDGPFEFSTTDNPKWYLLHSQEQNSVDANDYFANADGTIWQTKSQTDEKSLYSNKKYQWAFVGNPYALRLINRESGKPLSASANSGSNGSNIPLAVTDEDSYPYHEFTVYGYAGVLDESEGVVDPFVLILKDSYYGFLIYDGTMKYYSSGVSITDQLGLKGWRSSDLMVIEVPQTVEVTISAIATDGEFNYGTLYYGNMNLMVPEGLTAYTAAVSDGNLTLSEVTGAIPASTGVVLKTDSKLTSNTTFTFTEATEGGTVVAGNMLLGTDDAATTTAPEGSTGTYKFYALSLNGSNAENTVGFYYRKGCLSGEAFQNGAHKAYLAVPIEQTSGAKGFAFSDAVNSIEMPISDTTPKGEGIYNLSGQRVSTLSKGIFIVNGKKVVVK